MSHRVPVIKLDKIPGYDQKVSQQDLNPNQKLGFLQSQTRSASLKMKIHKKELSSQSEEVKTARENLNKCSIQVEQTTKILRTYEALFLKAVTQNSTNQALFMEAMNNARNALIELRKEYQRWNQQLKLLIAQRKW